MALLFSLLFFGQWIVIHLFEHPYDIIPYLVIGLFEVDSYLQIMISIV